MLASRILIAKRAVSRAATTALGQAKLLTDNSTCRNSTSILERYESTATATAATTTVVDTPVHRALTNDPSKHDKSHLYKFYTVKDEDRATLDPFREHFNFIFRNQCKAMKEMNLLIRDPAIEVISYMHEWNYSNPALRCILYGPSVGSGKRCTLFHLLHYCYKHNYLLVDLPHCSHPFRRQTEIVESSYNESRIDLPEHAMLFLKRFAVQNKELLQKLNLTTTKEYVWSPKDKSKEGTPLVDLLKLADITPKYSSDIVGVICREIKIQSQQSNKNFKVFVAANEVNSYFGHCRLKRTNDAYIQVDEISIIRSFKKLLKNDWSNAVIVGAVSAEGVVKPTYLKKKRNYDTTIPVSLRKRVETSLHYEGPLTPAHLLGRQGFEFFEPFVPIEVPHYNNTEFDNYCGLFYERNWLQDPRARTEEGREELKFLSGWNPKELMRISQSL